MSTGELRSADRPITQALATWYVPTVYIPTTGMYVAALVLEGTL